MMMGWTFGCQLLLLIAIITQILTNKASRLELVSMNWLNITIFCQFVCATILHLQNAEVAADCLKMMKFCLNQSYVFGSPMDSFLAVFLKFTMAIVTEFSCILVILSSNAPLEIVMNFIAIYVVAQFD